MSYEALTWAVHKRLDPVPRLVLIGLADRADKTGRAWPSVAWLADFAGFHRTTVMKELARLQRAQLIEPTGERRGLTGQVKVWRLRINESALPLGLPEAERGKGRSQSDPSERGKCRSIGDTLNGLKVSTLESTLNGSVKGRLGATGSRGRPVAPNAGKGRHSATRNQLEPVIIPSSKAEAVFDAWNRMASASGLSIARTLTPDRRAELGKRIEEHGADTILAAIETVPSSAFLTGDNARGWKADFDYFASARGMNRIVDGTFVGGASKAKG